VPGSPPIGRILLICALLAASPTHAESAFELPYPARFGAVPAATYDPDGQRIGEAAVTIERVEGGIRLLSHSGKRDGESTIATATFTPIVKGATMRLIRQESRSLDAEGNLLGVLLVDHLARRATCRKPDGTLVGEIELPASDRVVNVPMNLFFLPLVRGDKESMHFQLFLCREGARALDFEAWVANGRRGKWGKSKLVEVRYSPDFGSLVSIVARGFAPRLSFWFDPDAPHRWAGHRLPLFSGGPEVLVVRDGIPAEWLGD
jgi:hypothetical protein